MGTLEVTLGIFGLAKNRDEQAAEESEAGEKACGEARLEEGEATQAEEESDSD